MTNTLAIVRVGDCDVRVRLPENVGGRRAAVASLDTFGVHKQDAEARLPILARLAGEVAHPEDQQLFTEVASTGGQSNTAHAADVLTVFLDDYVRDVVGRPDGSRGRLRACLERSRRGRRRGPA
ncbi:hypothetical protein ABT061_20900 [Streptosporangium sp. NPDC002544]|uniref:hypothetical protein n=1 Tax=Streptosporangium sp. NPDC002544 TaxID=3154538 RepID=UPI0033176EDD